MRSFTRMARRAANRASNVNAALLACERSQVLFSLDQQQQQHQRQKHHTSMPRKKERKDKKAKAEDSEIYEVEDIIDDRVDPKTGEKMYLIKWLGYSKEESTWEHRSHLNCPLILARYRGRIDYAKKKKLKDTKNKIHQQKSSTCKQKLKKMVYKKPAARSPQKVVARSPQTSRKVVACSPHKKVVHKSHKGGSPKKSSQKGVATPLKVKIPLSKLRETDVASKEPAIDEQEDSSIQCDNVTSSSLLSQINSEFAVDSSSCDESFLQDEEYTFPTSSNTPVLEKFLFPWETTSADVPISVHICEYNNFYDPSNAMSLHYTTTPSVVSIEGADSSSLSVGSPAPPPLADSNFNLTLSPSLSSVTSLTTASDIEVVDDINDPAPIINSNNLQPTINHTSPNGTPPCANPVHSGKENHLTSSPRFRMTMQRVQRHMSLEYSTLTEPSVNGFNCPLSKNAIDSHLEHPYALRARDYQQELREWSAALNAKCKGKEAPIYVENNYDQFPIPKDLEYVCTNLYGKGVPNPADHEPVTYCKCLKCGIGNNGCCPAQLEALFPYYSNGRIRVGPGKPIYECNSACSCGPDCSNRVVQKLRSIPLCIFRTGDAKGWGVKAITEIKKNSFVCEYTGEVIMFDEAEQRGEVANAKGLTYIFDLDFHSEDDGCCFSIDASRYGNISHFFNHSCDPNLTVYSVWVDFIDPRLPRIAFFANRNIHEGEELTFDYQISYNTSHHQQFSRVKCLCGSKNCQKYLM